MLMRFGRRDVRGTLSSPLADLDHDSGQYRKPRI
jgi:hypothetical protein